MGKNYLHISLGKKNSDNYISALKFNNNLITNPKAVSIHASNYYNELYSTPNTYDTYEKLLLENFISVIGEEEMHC